MAAQQVRMAAQVRMGVRFGGVARCGSPHRFALGPAAAGDRVAAL